jgi:hypothetical protein
MLAHDGNSENGSRKSLGETIRIFPELSRDGLARALFSARAGNNNPVWQFPQRATITDIIDMA